MAAESFLGSLGRAAAIGASFLGTKYLGLDRTVRAFEWFGRRQRGMGFRGSRLSMDEIRARVERGYRFQPLPIECLDQAVVTWYLLNLHGHPARLRIGVLLAPLSAHAWVEARRRRFILQAGIEDFKVVAEYGPWEETRKEESASAGRGAIRLAPGVTLTKSGREAILFSKVTGDFHGASETGAATIRALLRFGFEPAVRRLAKGYRVAVRTIAADARTLIDDLATRGLVVDQSPDRKSRHQSR